MRYLNVVYDCELYSGIHRQKLKDSLSLAVKKCIYYNDSHFQWIFKYVSFNLINSKFQYGNICQVGISVHTLCLK